MAQESGKQSRNKKTEFVNESTQLDSPPIVGIGASSGGLKALQSLLHNLSPNISAAIVYLQHRQEGEQQMLLDILERDSPLPVEDLTDGSSLRSGVLYVAPAHCKVSVHSGTVRVKHQTGKLMDPIDYFFGALAVAKGTEAVAVVLSGQGNDGAIGMQSIFEYGGLTLVQSPDSAEFSGMPSAAVATGCALESMTAEEIGKSLAALVTRPQKERFFRTRAVDGEADKLLQRLFDRMKDVSGRDFSEYKLNTLERRLHRRMKLSGKDSLGEYMKLLEASEQEVMLLHDDFLIQVSSFFRGPHVYAILADQIFSELWRSRDKRSKALPVRVWVAGCSSGQEAYSIAITWAEFCRLNDIPQEDLQLQIFATDVSDEAIARARTARFSESSLCELRPEIVKRYFDPVGHQYAIKKTIRDTCVFATHDFTVDPAFSRMDIVSCRNVLIYLKKSLQQKAIRAFHYALKPGGILLLGDAESLSEYAGMFEAVNSDARIYRRREALSLHGPAAASGMATRPGWSPEKGTATTPGRAATTAVDLSSRFEEVVLQALGITMLLVEAQDEVVQIRGPTTFCVDLAPGTMSFNLYRILRDELKLPVRTLIKEVRKTSTPAERKGISIRLDDLNVRVDVSVRKVRTTATQKDSLLLLIAKRPETFRPPGGNKAASGKGEAAEYAQELDEVNQRLRQELNSMREDIQSSTEQFSSMNEELRGANEELQSSNEELRSTNEELQTAKEEIQSSNEELLTMNEELNLKNTALTNYSDDMQNLLHSAQLPILILDKELKVRRFTPATKQLFKLIDSDVGRPIGDVRAVFPSEALQGLCRTVMDTMQIRDMQVRTDENNWYNMTVRPFRTKAQRIEGTVITFVGADEIIVRSKALQQFAATLRGSSDAVIVSDPGGFIKDWNYGAEQLYGFSQNEAINQDLSIYGGPEWEIATAKVLQQLQAGQPTVSYEGKRTKKNGELIDVHVVATPVKGDSGEVIGLVSIERDITKFKQREDDLMQGLEDADLANRAKSEFLANMSHEIRTPLTAIIGFTELLQSGAISASAQGEYLQRIRRSGQHLRQLIDDILDLAKIEADRLQLELSRVNVIDELENCVLGLRAMAESKGIFLKSEIVGEVPTFIESDALRFRQVLNNVIGNAVKFTSKGGVSVVMQMQQSGTSEQDRILLITVSDTGCGIPAADRETLFQRFVRSSVASAEQYRGTGLGLVLSRRMAGLLSGSVELESSAVGKGSKFVIKLPIRGREHEFTDSRNRHPGGTDQESALKKFRNHFTGKSALVVEDDPELRTLMVETLEVLGFKVETAVNGTGAIACLEREATFDIVLMDLQMPEMCGFEATAKLRQIGYKGPIVAVTARLLNEERAKCLESGCTDIIPKPFTADSILKVLQAQFQ